MFFWLVKSDSFSLDELLDEDLVCWLWVGLREEKVFVHHNSIETINIILLLQEGQLFRKDAFERLVSYWNLEKLWKYRQEATESEHQIDIPWKVVTHLRMTNLHSYFFTIHSSWVNLTDWAGCDRNRVKFFEHLLNLFAINSLYCLYGVDEFMLRRVFS